MQREESHYALWYLGLFGQFSARALDECPEILVPSSSSLLLTVVESEVTKLTSLLIAIYQAYHED
jgi:hypothetical protein